MRKLVQLLLAVPAAAAATDYDLLVRGARVVDGTGSPWYRADVGVRAGVIAAVGALDAASATTVALAPMMQSSPTTAPSSSTPSSVCSSAPA